VSSKDTRTRLINLIKDHQLENGLSKLKISTLSDQAGITRQAFNRFYGDLKPYTQGLSIAPLLTDDSNAALDLLARREHELQQLRDEISTIKSQHAKDLTTAINKHITTLMNSDLIMFDAKSMEATLENQSKHNNLLKRQLMHAQVQNANLSTDLASLELHEIGRNPHLKKTAKNFMSLGMNFAEFAIHSNSLDAFEDAKDDQLNRHIKTLKKLSGPDRIEIHLFQERYVSSFKEFCDGLPAKDDMLTVVIQTPVYAQAELKSLLRQLIDFSSVTLHIPYQASQAAQVAFQKFHFRQIPSLEFEEANKSRVPQFDWGFDSIKIFRAD
jgi:hypothetical protein